MTLARTHLESAPAARALARGQALFRSVTPERPVVLYGAALQDSALVLGAHQHAADALSEAGRAQPLLRRRTGGATVALSPGVAYLAVGLSRPSSMMACPPGKLLNRNVRGCLGGLRRLKLPAHYFGRDFVSLEALPVAYIGWSEAADGRALLELFVAQVAPFAPEPALLGYPERKEPMFRGRSPTTLAQAGSSADTDAVLKALFEGHAVAYGLDLESTPPTAQEDDETGTLAARVAIRADHDDGLCWGPPREEAIGFVHAGARLDDAGRITALTIGGDLMQHEGCTDVLAEALVGRAPDATEIGAAVDRAYAARPGLLEGVRSLATLQRALLDAISAASAAAASTGSGP